MRSFECVQVKVKNEMNMCPTRSNNNTIYAKWHIPNEYVRVFTIQKWQFFLQIDRLWNNFYMKIITTNFVHKLKEHIYDEFCVLLFHHSFRLNNCLFRMYWIVKYLTIFQFEQIISCCLCLNAKHIFNDDLIGQSGKKKSHQHNWLKMVWSLKIFSTLNTSYIQRDARFCRFVVHTV